ncbi:MAG TPA: hypothetical protein VFG73_08460 [Rhodanobacteraceae bacterium]|nr:hypothetical protein [Rhodanobacteraceae bacterium]
MHRMRGFMLLAMASLALAACGSRRGSEPLDWVPAQTPFLAANLQPLDADSEQALLEPVNRQLPGYAAQLDDLAAVLADKPKLAALARALSDEIHHVGSVQQLAKDAGINPRGLFAVYAVGLSPVVRAQLGDKARFDAFVQRLQQAAGAPLVQAKLGDKAYRHMDFGPLQLALAVQHDQAVLALLPSAGDASLLRGALGFDRPEHSVAEAGTLADLAKADDYLPGIIAYLDTTRLPALLTENQPVMKAATNGARLRLLPSNCRADLDRIAARVPMLSVGLTAIDDQHVAARTDLRLAPDIVEAIAQASAPVAGLGGSASAPLDLAVALPLQAIAQFLHTQAAAVAAKPFSCMELAVINGGFARLRSLPASLPPWTDLLGLRIALDAVDIGGKHPLTIRGRLLLASSNPEALLATLAQWLPPLAGVQPKADGTPVALPATAASSAGMFPPTALALNEHALGLAIGGGEADALAALLENPGNAPGSLARVRIDGSFYVDLMQRVLQQQARRQQAAAKTLAQSGDPKVQALARLQRDRQSAMAAQIAQFHDLKSLSAELRVGEHGLVYSSEFRRK